MSTGSNIREYRPNSRLEETPWQAVTHLCQEVYRHRSHVATMFRKDFRASYEGTWLGVFWNFFLPILPVTIYIGLAALRVVPQFEGVHSAVAISLNATLWFLYSAFLTSPITVVKSRNASAMKTSLPLSASLVASFARSFFETLVRLALVLAAALVVGAMPVATVPLAVLVVLMGCLLFGAIGLIASIANIVVPDLQRVVTALMMYGIFLSGVIFPLSGLPYVGFLEWANPFAVFIQAARELAFTGELTHPLALGLWSAAAVVAGLAGVRLFYVMEYRIRSVL